MDADTEIWKHYFVMQTKLSSSVFQTNSFLGSFNLTVSISGNDMLHSLGNWELISGLDTKSYS